MPHPTVGLDQSSTEVHAVLEAVSLSRPPIVLLSFAGLHEPVGLFGDLSALGWIIPTRPPRPAAAIEWSASGAGGHTFTVLDYRIDDFRVQPGAWPLEFRPRIGALTVAVLQKHQVHVHANDAYLRLLFPEQLDAMGELEVIDLRSPVDPLPNTVIIERSSDSMARLCDYRTYGAKCRSTDDVLVWAERARQVAPSETRAQASIVSNAMYAWRIAGGEAPDTAATDERSLRIIVPDARTSNALVASLRSMMGDRVGTLALEPMTGAVNTLHAGLLIVGLVASDKIDRVRDLLVERNPTIIVRV